MEVHSEHTPVMSVPFPCKRHLSQLLTSLLGRARTPNRYLVRLTPARTGRDLRDLSAV